jgi:hypothetical protein
MERRPLADNLAIGPGIGNLIGLHPGKLVGCGVANAVTAGLVGVHFHFRQFRQDIGHIFQRRPVQLDVLAGGEVGVALVVVPGNAGKPAQLVRAQHAVGNTDPEHGSQTLNVQAVLQTKGKKLIFGKLASQSSFGLVTELCNPLGSHLPIVFIVYVHSGEILI